MNLSKNSIGIKRTQLVKVIVTPLIRCDYCIGLYYPAVSDYSRRSKRKTQSLLY